MSCRPTGARGSPRRASLPAALPGRSRSRVRLRWPAPRSWTPPVPLQRGGGKAADAAALTVRFRQFRDHHLGGAVRVSILAQCLRDDGRTPDVDFERLAVVEPLRLG